MPKLGTCELKHVGSERDDDELCVPGPLLDVVGHDGDVLEVQGRVNLVHHVQRRWLVVMESKHLQQIQLIYSGDPINLNCKLQ